MAAGLFNNNRNDIRQAYCEVWRKHQESQPLSALEQLILDIVLQHSEYHALLADPDKALGSDYLPESGETNPFLHMGMHIAIREQLNTDRPAGIRDIYKQLLTKLNDAHLVEHQIMECLGQALWQAQRDNRPPDDLGYVNCLRALLS